MYLQFFAPNRSFCLVNVIRLVFVTTFLKSFLVLLHLYTYTKNSVLFVNFDKQHGVSY